MTATSSVAAEGEREPRRGSPLLRRLATVQSVPRHVLVLTALASYGGQILAAVAGWPLWAIVLATVLPWVLVFALELNWTYRHFTWLALFYLLVVTQGGHFLAQVVHVVQIHLPQEKGPETQGVIGQLNMEWVQFGFSTWVLLAVLILLQRYRHIPWLWVALVVAVWHEVEHAVIVARYLVTGVEGDPGLLSAGGLIGGGLPITRPDVDLIYNLAVTVPLFCAFGHTLKHSYDEWLARAFPHAPASLLIETTSRLKTTRFQPGEVVVAEDDPADCFYIITAGEAEVTQRAEDGEVYVATLGPGQFFGEVGLLTSAPRTATVRAQSTLDVLSLDRHSFRQVVEQSESTAQDLGRLVNERTVRHEARDDAVTLPPWTRLIRRILKHPRLMHYNRLIALVMAVNVVLLGYGLTAGGWWSSQATDLNAVAIVAQGNFALAIILRQQYVINFLGWLATRPPATLPLKVRWTLGKYYHFGGLHVGAAVSGTLWYLVFVGALTYDAARGLGTVSIATIMVAYLVVTLFIVIVVMALPPLRARAHDNFEATHRFCGWAALVLVWVNTVLFVASQRGDASLASSLLTAPTVWMLVVTTICAAVPWLLLRKVPITVERPSSHVALVGLDHGVKPFVGSTRAISRNPLLGWHSFANIPAPAGSPGYRMAISRAGDWTGAFIDDPPEHVWVRGIPTVGVANVKKLFKKVVYVATGSGIGPVLGHLLTNEVPSGLVWVTRKPRETYGDALVDEILAAQPDAIVWNTDERGKPDMVRLTYNAYLSFGAEAVICVSNKKVTWQVVHGLERRGIPAFGPIWDS